jgi:hypothetical protein
MVHSKFIAFNCLKVFENSTIWRPLQEDQDCSIPPSFDLEERKGRRNAFPKVPSIQQENQPQVSPHYSSVAYKLSLDELKDKAAYILFALQVSKGSGPGTPTYRKSIRTFEKGDPQQWMEVITGLKEIWAQNSITVLMDMLNTAAAILKGDSLTSYKAAMEDNRTNPDDKSLMVPMTEQHIDDALLAVTNKSFHIAL